jgi:hypothetical protein
MLAGLQRDLDLLEIRLMLAGLHAPVVEMLRRGGITEKVGAANYFSTLLDALLTVAREQVDHLTPDEVASVIDRIDTLTEIISFASERASAENKARFEQVLSKMGEIRDHLKVQ